VDFSVNSHAHDKRGHGTASFTTETNYSTARKFYATVSSIKVSQNSSGICGLFTKAYQSLFQPLPKTQEVAFLSRKSESASRKMRFDFRFLFRGNYREHTRTFGMDAGVFLYFVGRFARARRGAGARTGTGGVFGIGQYALALAGDPARL
jgi:hypothetical protein